MPLLLRMTERHHYLACFIPGKEMTAKNGRGTQFRLKQVGCLCDNGRGTQFRRLKQVDMYAWQDLSNHEHPHSVCTASAMLCDENLCANDKMDSRIRVMILETLLLTFYTLRG